MNKKYEIIYADPPWSYNDKMSGHSFSLDHEYETQPLHNLSMNYNGSNYQRTANGKDIEVLITNY